MIILQRPTRTLKPNISEKEVPPIFVCTYSAVVLRIQYKRMNLGTCKLFYQFYYDNTPMQYTEIFTALKNVKFLLNFFDIFFLTFA